MKSSKNKKAPVIGIEPYATFSRTTPWTDQGKTLLIDSDAFKAWVRNFRPSATSKNPMQRITDLNRGFDFDVIPPSSYPAIVIYVRTRRSGLTECEFWWDYSYPKDFSQRTDNAAPKKVTPKANKKKRSKRGL